MELNGGLFLCEGKRGVRSLTFYRLTRHWDAARHGRPAAARSREEKMLDLDSVANGWSLQ